MSPDEFKGLPPQEHIFTGRELWPFVLTLDAIPVFGSWPLTYYGKNQDKNERLKVILENKRVKLYASDGIFLFHFVCYIVKLRTKGGVILTDPEDIFNFISS